MPILRSDLTTGELAWILDRLPGGLIVVDRSFCVCYSNLAASRLAQSVGAKLRPGRPLPNLGGEPQLRELAANLIEHGLIHQQELRCDGRTLIVSGRAHSRMRFAVLEIDDDTARTERLRAGEDFVVNAAHEFLSPLTTITSAAQVLREGAKNVPESRDRFIEHIAAAADRLTMVSRSLLALARAEAGLEPPRPELFSLRPLLEEVIAGRATPGLEYELACSTSVKAFVDQDLLRLAFSQLFDNAVKHSRPGRPISIVVDEVGHEAVGLEVANDGGGIADDDRERIMERFFNLTGRDGHGFGIGLSIAARSIQLLGGRLHISTDDGRTRVRVEIPAARMREPGAG
jgi:signal transduction histidine kinase